ncbi:MAG: glycosyltransferase [Thermodesulfovibrionales bacterium]
MIEGENIICISFLNWDRLPLVMHQMMTRIAKRNRVLFVDPPVALTTPLFHPKKSSGFVSKKIAYWIKGVKKVNENLYVYYPLPLFLQFGHFALNDTFNQWYLGSAVNFIARKLRFDSPILWLYEPFALNPNGQLGEKLVCFDCSDDISAFESFHYKRKKLLSLEEEFVKKVDVVFTTSRNLFNTKKALNPNTHYFPSGVDVEHFQKALSPSCAVPEDVKMRPKPIIGFIGEITNYRINWEWIINLSVSRPEWSIVFIGPCMEKPPENVLALRNLFFLGKKDMQSLPAYLKAFDVGIIPYKGEEFLKTCQPTKTFEYLAAGKPVVSSFIPELEDYTSVVRLAKNEGEFLSHLDAALADKDNADFVERCIKIARDNTWDKRVEGTTAIIASMLKQKKTGSGKLYKL